MKNKILKLVFGIALLFLINKTINNDQSLTLVSDELINNLNNYEKDKVIQDYAAYIVQYIIINSGLTEQIKTEEEAKVLKNHIENMIKKLIINNEFCNLCNILIKEQLSKLNNYENLKKKYKFLKLLIPVSIFSLITANIANKLSFLKVKINLTNNIGNISLISALISTFLYIEKKGEKENTDYLFKSGSFSSTEKTKELYILAYNEVISPYLEEVFAKKENKEEKTEETK